MSQSADGHNRYEMRFPALDPGLPRELLAILSLYLGTLLNGYSFAFSAVAIPDMKREMR